MALKCVNIDKVIEKLDKIEAQLIDCDIEEYSAYADDLHEISAALGMIRAQRR